MPSSVRGGWAVIAIDDSLSSGRGRGETVFEQQRALALAYLDTLSPGDEISILTASGWLRPLPIPCTTWTQPVLGRGP